MPNTNLEQSFAVTRRSSGWREIVRTKRSKEKTTQTVRWSENTDIVSQKGSPSRFINVPEPF